jgi:O-antigen/teichoic acid export membrane protein
MISRVIARNSFWYGLESGINMCLTFFTSIAIARTIGPTNLSYFLYVWYLVNAASAIGSLGIPTATRKYMSEFLGRGESGIAKAVFFRTLGFQFTLAILITASSLVAVFTSADPQYRTVAALMVASIFPAMLNSIPAQANMAAENMAANVPGSLVSTAIFVSSVFLSVTTGSGLLGISLGLFTMRFAEMLVRLIPVLRRLRAVPPTPIPEELRRRMFLFSGRSVVLLILGLVVWDRSEMLFLKNFCTDMRQVAFYSVGFNITERLLLFSQIFGQATGSTIMVQYGRNQSRIGSMVSSAVRYLALVAFPVHFGLAAIGGAVMLMVYGKRYELAIAPLVISALFGVFKAFLLPIQHLLESTENQNALIHWGLIAGIVNIALDILLIPHFGALGAAVANGTTQAFSVIALWAVGIRLIGIRLPFAFLGRIAGLSAAMAITVHYAVSGLQPVAQVCTGVLIGTILYVLLLRLARGLESQDHKRLSQFRLQLPLRIRKVFDFALNFLVPASQMAISAETRS